MPRCSSPVNGVYLQQRLAHFGEVSRVHAFGDWGSLHTGDKVGSDAGKLIIVWCGGQCALVLINLHALGLGKGGEVYAQ